MEGPSRPAKDVRVVVVAYRSGDMLGTCVDSALASTGASVTVTVVNNDPTDTAPADLARDRDIEYVPMASNVGFCRAVNVALQHGKEPYVLLLNPDARLSRDYAARLAERMEADQTLGSAGGRILLGLHAGTATIDSLGIEIARGRHPRDIGHGHPDDGNRSGVVERFGVTAAAAMYRRSALDEVRIDGQVLPESFFMYLDDVDLAWRLRLWGYRSVVDLAAVAWHERAAARGVTADRGRLRGVLRSMRRAPWIREVSWANLLLMLIRNDDTDLFLEDARHFLARRAPRDALTVLQNPQLGLRQRIRLASRFPAALRERAIIQASRRAEASELRPWIA